MNMREYKEKYPELARETIELLREGKDILRISRRVPKERTDAGSTLSYRTDLPTRLKLATTDRQMKDGESWIPVLYPDVNNPDKKDRYGRPCGASLAEATEQQRNAYFLQQEILESCVYENDRYHWMTKEDWDKALGRGKYVR